jgi:AraC-like DNA-binding protein
VIGFLDIINIITIFQLCFFSVFLLTLKKGNLTSHKILAVFFITQASCICNTFCWRFYSYTHENIPWLFYIGETILFLWGPSLYFYVYSMTNYQFRFKYKHIIHLLPLLSHFTYMFFKFHRHNNDIKRELLDSGVLNSLEHQVWYIIFHTLIICYIIAAFIELNNYRKKIKTFFSSTERISFFWVSFILVGFVFIWICDVSYFTINLFGKAPVILIQIVYPTVFILANIIVFRALKQPEVIIQFDEHQKYKQSTLSESDKEKYLNDLLNLMSAEKPYRIPSLTINDLSGKLSVSSKYLSQIINERLRQNFFDFINSYRIKEACNMLKDNSSEKMTILEILYEVGYNTKSSFNKAFLKFNNITPTEYRTKFSN